jgi:two-component system sensor histidine kinase VicK
LQLFGKITTFTGMHHLKDPLFQILFNQLAEARLILKAEPPVFTVISNNDAWHELFNSDAAMLSGKPFIEVCANLNSLYEHVDLEQQFAEVIHLGQPLTLPPVSVDPGNGDGRATWLELEILPIKDVSGDSTAYLMCTLHEVTSRIISQQAVVQAKEAEATLVLEQQKLNKEQELNEELASINEELAAANEELASSNEELVATNEELFETQSHLEELFARLMESERRFRSLFDQSPVGMCFLKGEDFIIDLANENILKIWGRNRAEVIGKPHQLARPELQGQPMNDWLREVYGTGTQRINNELKVQLYAGEGVERREAYVHSVYHPLKDHLGKVSGLLIILTDITAWVSARKQLEDARKLEEIRKSDFIAIVSHELKTPLTSLKGYLQLMQMKSRDKEELSFFNSFSEKSLSQIEKMHAMIKGFLDVARLESGKLVLNLQPVFIDELIAEGVEEAMLLSQSHEIVIKPCVPRVILADKEKIVQILDNLLSNAIKYSPLGKIIEVSCTFSETEVVVEVKDQGMGIKAHQMERLFDRFYRVETKHTKGISGFGIGLYLCSEIIRLHQGRIWAESEVGVGSSFFFSLPLQGPSPGSQ